MCAFWVACGESGEPRCEGSSCPVFFWPVFDGMDAESTCDDRWDDDDGDKRMTTVHTSYTASATELRYLAANNTITKYRLTSTCQH